MADKTNDSNTHWQRVKSLFGEVMDLPADERDTFLRREAGDDKALLDAVRSLMSSSSETRGAMENIIQQAAAEFSAGPGEKRIGNYEIERLIGEGGMGDVFLANRADGKFKQKVAVKVLGARRPDKELVRRFQAERQILANLEHPNIARLIDGGETKDGVPYLVMEYVDGKPITEYCDEHRLSTRERLAILVRVCAAVQHAHQNLVIHRDIKPTNILVTEEGEPKLLDFGIAKLLQPELMDQTMVETMDSQRLMTPRHASPEQIRGDKITIATDIYSLGVLIYELLSGLFPYKLSSSRAADIENAICDTEPAKPSARLTGGGADIANKISAARSARRSELARQIGGDLDNIVLTAMQKDPARRYSTVHELSSDIQMFLQYRPVRARADSVLYRMSKFVRRNRFPVSVATAALVLVVSATSLSFARVSAERNVAESERQKAEAVSDFMQQIFEISDPEESRGEAISARELLEAGSRRIRTELSDQPEVQASMLRVLGEVYYSLGDLENAELLLDDGLNRMRDIRGENDADVATAKLALAIVYQDWGRSDEAAVLIDESLATREALFGHDHFDTAEATSVKAFLMETTGDYVGAEALHREALMISQRVATGDDTYVAETMTKLAGLYRILGRTDEAEPLLRDALAMQDRLYGGEHPQSADTKRQLAGLLRETRRFDESEALYKEVIASRERMLGPDHVEVAHTWNSYSQMLADKGDLDGAVVAHQEFISILERGTDGPHASFGAAYNNFAVLLKQQGDYEGALKNYQLSIDMQDQVELPPRHPNRSFPLGGVANVYLALGRFEECAELTRLVLEMRREHFAESHRVVSEVKSILGAALTGTDDYAEAEQHLLDAYSIFASEQGPEHPGALLTAGRLADLYAETGDATNENNWREIESQASEN